MGGLTREQYGGSPAAGAENKAAMTTSDFLSFLPFFLAIVVMYWLGFPRGTRFKSFVASQPVVFIVIFFPIGAVLGYFLGHQWWVTYAAAYAAWSLMLMATRRF
jgi:hypothetical protein